MPSTKMCLTYLRRRKKKQFDDSDEIDMPSQIAMPSQIDVSSLNQLQTKKKRPTAKNEHGFG
jgi:hypothetical protein